MKNQAETKNALWTPRPREDEAGVQFRVVRCPIAGTKGWVVMSNDITGARTHYARDRTRPCNGIDCEICKEGSSSRWYGWIFIWNPTTDARVIFELTAAAAAAADEYIKKHGTLRGAELDAFRKPKRINGRLYVHFWKKPGDYDRLPDPPEIKPILMNMWGMNRPTWETGEEQAEIQRLEDDLSKRRRNR